MTIRVPAQIQEIDAQKLAAVLTRAVLNPTIADARSNAHEPKLGTSWVHWSDAQNHPKKARHPLD
jgi:hypothetical protein